MNWKKFTSPDQLKKTILLLALGLIVGVLGVWVAYRLLTPSVQYFCSIVMQPEHSGRSSRERPVSIEAITVKKTDITKRITTVGKLKANNSVVLKAETGGKIKEILFTEGTQVAKDTVLIRFEDKDAQAELVQAEAELSHRELDYERVNALHSKNFESVKKRDEAKALLAAAKAKVDVAKVRLAKTIISAPFEGVIGLMDVSPGAVVQASQDLVAIVDSTPMKIDFKIPEKNLHDVGEGQAVEIKLNGFPNEVFRGVVNALDSKIDSQSHSISVRASTPNEDSRLRAGLFANVSVIIGTKNAIVVPETSVYRDGDGEYVWAVHKGKAIKGGVITGTRENNMVEIIAGLPEGVVLITSGHAKLNPQSPVVITSMNGKISADKTTDDDESNQKTTADSNTADQTKTEKNKAH